MVDAAVGRALEERVGRQHGARGAGVWSPSSPISAAALYTKAGFPHRHGTERQVGGARAQQRPHLRAVEVEAVPGDEHVQPGRVAAAPLRTTEFAVVAAGRLGLQLGASISVGSASRSSTGAGYWDGAAWVDRRDCSG